MEVFKSLIMYDIETMDTPIGRLAFMKIQRPILNLSNTFMKSKNKV